MYSVNWITRVVTIPKADLAVVSVSPDVCSLDVTDLWTSLIDIQDGEDGISFPDIVRNIEPVTVAGVTLARVVEIINSYTLTFEDGQYAVNIVNGNSNVADVNNKNQVSVNTANSSGTVLRSLPEVVKLQYLIESQAASHSGFENIWYWDPYGGNDTNNGQTPTTAMKTFNSVQARAGTFGDTIFILSRDPSVITTVTDPIVITKKNLRLRGPGETLRVVVSDPLLAAITIAASGAQVKGLLAKHTGVKAAIEISGVEDVLLEDIGSYFTGGNCIEITAGSNIITMRRLAIEHAVGHGLSVTGTPAQPTKTITVYDTHIDECSIDGVFATGTVHNLHLLDRVIIHGSGRYGVNMETVNVNHTLVSNLALIIDSGVAHFRDLGTTNIYANVKIDPAEVQEGLTSHGYTTSRASKLDNLDAAVSSLEGAGLTTAQATMMLEMYKLMGLDPTKPLIVTPTTRKVPANGADISQTITEVGSDVTVQRV